MPWHRDAGAPLFMPANALTRNLYQGINTVVLWVSAEQQGYQHSRLEHIPAMGGTWMPSPQG